MVLPTGSFYDVRRRPYLVLFPVAVALSWWGVGHWVLHAAGWLADYRPRFHALAQTQGFMTCLVMGFLLTMIPRRTKTAPPALALVLFVAMAPALTVALAWGSRWVWAQGVWLTGVLALVAFIARRAGGPGEARLPNGFVWLPGALLMAVSGAVAIIAAELGADSGWRQIGEGLTQQGFLMGVVLGVGGALVLPLMTRGEPPGVGPVSGRDQAARALHLSGAVLFAASFWLEQAVSLSLAMAVRSGVTLAVLVGCAELWRRPRRPGLTAHVIWVAAWLVPVGYALAAAAPLRFRAGLHVSLVGGLALLGLSVSAQVILGHGGHVARARRWAFAGVVMTTLTGLALGARVLQETDRSHAFLWMGLAAALFLGATAAWIAYVAPGILRPDVPQDSG